MDAGHGDERDTATLRSIDFFTAPRGTVESEGLNAPQIAQAIAEFFHRTFE